MYQQQQQAQQPPSQAPQQPPQVQPSQMQQQPPQAQTSQMQQQPPQAQPSQAQQQQPQVQQQPQSQAAYHTVRPKDTIFWIAKMHNTTVENIMNNNPGINPYNLQVGSRVVVFPGQGGAAPNGMPVNVGQITSEQTVPGQSTTGGPGVPYEQGEYYYPSDYDYYSAYPNGGYGTSPDYNNGQMGGGYSMMSESSGMVGGNYSMMPDNSRMSGGNYSTMPEGNRMPGGTYSTMPEGNRMPGGSYSTMPEGNRMSGGTYSTMPESNRMSGGTYPRMPENNRMMDGSCSTILENNRMPGGIGAVTPESGRMPGSPHPTPPESSRIPGSPHSTTPESHRMSGGQPSTTRFPTQTGCRTSGRCAPASAYSSPAGYIPPMTDSFGHPEYCKLRDDMRRAFTKHVYGVRALLTSMADRLGDLNVVKTELMKNPREIADIFVPYFSAEAADGIAALLAEHLKIGGEIIAAQRDRQADKTKELKRQWQTNADSLANLFEKMNPNYNIKELQKLLNDHLEMTGQEVTMRLNKDYPEEAKAFGKVFRGGEEMADYLAEGIVQ